MTDIGARTRAEERQASADEDLLLLRDVAQSPGVGGVLDAVRQLLAMEVAYVAHLRDDLQVFGAIRGDGDSFGIAADGSQPFDQTYCHRVLSGRLPSIIPDVRADDRARSLPITERWDVGSFASVPLRCSDGSLLGTLCAASHDAKPSLGYRELQFLQVFARLAADELEREALREESSRLAADAAASSALSSAADLRDRYPVEHSRQVVAHAVAVGDRLGLSDRQLEEVRQVALLHDIGKIAIPDRIIAKQGELDPVEWEVIRVHPEIGAELVRETPGLAHLAPAIRAEHERWDGEGYPDGLAGERIPLASRITFVCGAYHAMTSDRPYREALPPAEARRRVKAGSGTQFWPDAVDALLTILAEDDDRA